MTNLWIGPTESLILIWLCIFLCSLFLSPFPPLPDGWVGVLDCRPSSNMTGMLLFSGIASYCQIYCHSGLKLSGTSFDVCLNDSWCQVYGFGIYHDVTSKYHCNLSFLYIRRWLCTSILAAFTRANRDPTLPCGLWCSCWDEQSQDFRTLMAEIFLISEHFPLHPGLAGLWNEGQTHLLAQR